MVGHLAGVIPINNEQREEVLGPCLNAGKANKTVGRGNDMDCDINLPSFEFKAGINIEEECKKAWAEGNKEYQDQVCHIVITICIRDSSLNANYACSLGCICP